MLQFGNTKGKKVNLKSELTISKDVLSPRYFLVCSKLTKVNRHNPCGKQPQTQVFLFGGRPWHWQDDDQ